VRRRRAGPSIRDIAASGQVLETEEAQRTAQRLARIVESHGDAILSVDLRRRVRTWNPAARRIFGYRETEIIGKPVTLLAPPPLRDELLATVRRAAREGRAELETRRIRKDGSMVYVSVAVAPLRDPRGRLIGFSATLRDVSERRRVEESLRESEEKFRMLFETGNDAVFVHELGSRKRPGPFTQVNAVACSRYGYTREELLRMSPVELDVGGMDAAREQAIGTMLATGRCVFEMLHKKKDGTRIPVEVSSRVFTLQGRRQVLSIVRDITERKRAEAVLKASEEKFRRLVENLQADHFFYRHGTDGVFSYLSPSIRSVLGYTQKEFLTHYSAYLTENPVNREVVAHTDRSIRGEQQPPYLVEIFHKDGSRHWLRVLETPVSGEAGRVVAVEGMAQDITDQMRADAALRESESRFRILVEASPIAICVIREGRMVLVNKAFLSLFGYRCAEQVVGRPLAAFVAKECAARMAEQHRRRLAGDAAPSDFETVVRRKDGSAFPVSMQVGSLLLPEGPASLCHFTDITARKRGEKELQSVHARIVAAQETERKRLSRDLHDGVGQILSGAKYSLHSLAAELAAAAPRGAKRALKVADLLDGAVAEVRRVSWNLMPPELEAMGLAAAVRTHCQEFSEGRGLPVSVECRGLPSGLSADIALPLFRIIQEALANIAAHSRATSAAIRLSRKGGRIELSIVDDGTGFRPRSRRRRGGMRGAGLANIQERAESLGGTLALFSAPKQGTQLVVRLPLTMA